MTQFTIDNYITINGRLRRKDYWLMALPLWILGLIAAVLTFKGILPDAVNIIISLTSLIIQIMMDIRRFHDRDKSAWWVLVFLIPIVGPIWILVELGFLRGTIGPNRYGPDPVI